MKQKYTLLLLLTSQANLIILVFGDNQLSGFQGQFQKKRVKLQATQWTVVVICYWLQDR